MTRSLQRRFVAAAMAAVTVLLLFLLGAINGANLFFAHQRLEHTLEMLGDTGGDIGRLPPPQPGGPEHPGMDRNDYDTFLSSNFFVVRFGPEGWAVFADVSRTSQVSQEEAVRLAEEARASGQNEGSSGSFRYLLRENPPFGLTAVFLDTAGEQFSCLRVLALSGGLGLGCWLGMLAVVVLRSKKAIRPIAENIQRQKQFVTNAGHELKTPLAIIRSNAEALELYTGASKWSGRIIEQTARMDGLVKNMLLLARMDEGAGSARPEEIDFSALLAEVLEEFAQPMGARGMVLRQDAAPAAAVYGDRAQVRQMLALLLDNAVKHGRDSGEIQVSLSQKDGRVQLWIENTCPVLPDCPPEKLFQRFYRADSARSQKSGGSGIGLSAVRALAAANRVRVQAEYLLPDRVRFTINFPQPGPHRS